MRPGITRITQTYLAVSLILGMLLGVPQPSQAQVSFTSKVDFTTGLTPVAFAVADLNGDGKLDLAVINQDANTVSVLLGVGDGTFGAKSDFATGLTPVALALADLNRDGKLDLVVTNQGASTVSVLLNTAPPAAGGGGGCLIASAAYGSRVDPHVLALRDFRDRYLVKNAVGREFVSLYYTYSPPIATVIARSEAIRLATRIILTPMVYAINYPLGSAFLGAVLLGLVLSGLRKRAHTRRR